MYAQHDTEPTSGFREADEIRKMGEVPAALDRLEKELAMNREAAERLVARLELVSMRGPSETADRDSVPTPVRSPAADRLTGFSEKASRLTAFLRDATDALDL